MADVGGNAVISSPSFISIKGPGTLALNFIFCINTTVYFTVLLYIYICFVIPEVLNSMSVNMHLHVILIFIVASTERGLWAFFIASLFKF